MDTHFYNKAASSRIADIKEFAPDAYQAFKNFSETVFKDGALSKKFKELIAVATANMTRCPYCITSHTKKAKDCGATDEEIAEAIMVASAINAWASITHSTVSLDILRDK